MPNDDEIAYHEEQRSRFTRSLEELPQRTKRENMIVEGVRARDRLITAPRDADYEPPEHFRRTVAPAALRDLRSLLRDLRRLREQLVGLRVGDAEALYSGDEFAVLLRDSIDDWVTRHARSRIAKPSPRDDGDPFAKFQRLVLEFSRWFDGLVHAEGQGHQVALAGLDHKLGWTLAQGTWFRLLTRNEAGAVRGIDMADRGNASICGEIYRDGQWGRERAVATQAAMMREVWVTGDSDALRVELKAMSADIREMRGLVIRGYRPEDHVVEVAGGVFAAWVWEVGHTTGVLAVGRSADGVARQVLRREQVAVEMDLSGTPRDPAMPWLDLGPQVLPWTVGILRPVHRRLLEVWETAPRPAAAAPVGDDTASEVEAVAAACERIARSEEKESRVLVPGVRRITLLNLLERHFGCEIKKGKGSEITVWRPGGRKYILPGHKGNTHFHSYMVTAMLKVVGIDPGEFCRVAGRQ